MDWATFLQALYNFLVQTVIPFFGCWGINRLMRRCNSVETHFFMVAVKMNPLTSTHLRKKESLIFLLLAHHGHDQLERTIHLKLLNKDLFLCARGVGRYSGIISILVLTSFLQFPLWFYPLSFILFPLPSTIDWGLQKIGRRESRNSIRIITGFLVGNSQSLLIVSYLQGLTQIFNFGIIIMLLYFLAFCFAKYHKRGMGNVQVN